MTKSFEHKLAAITSQLDSIWTNICLLLENVLVLKDGNCERSTVVRV